MFSITRIGQSLGFRSLFRENKTSENLSQATVNPRKVNCAQVLVDPPLLTLLVLSGCLLSLPTPAGQTRGGLFSRSWGQAAGIKSLSVALRSTNIDSEARPAAPPRHEKTSSHRENAAVTERVDSTHM